jgi:hypothetical protein
MSIIMNNFDSMELINCLQVNFQTRSMIISDNLAQPKTSNLPFQLPKIIKRRNFKFKPSQIPKIKGSPQEFIGVTRTTVGHIEEIFSPSESDKKYPIKTHYSKRNISNPSKNYIEFYDKIDKIKLRKLKKKQETKANTKKSPWRYSAISTNSVFDVNLIAEKFFKTEMPKDS